MKEIVLTQGKVAFVDDDMFPQLCRYKWTAHDEKHTWYALRYTARKYCDPFPKMVVRMHNAVFPHPTGYEIDHINGNGLDNRKCNLRLVTRRQNLQNLHIEKSSVYPGVCWDKQAGKWLARLRIGNTRKHIGHFKMEKEAAVAYSDACLKYAGETVCLH